MFTGDVNKENQSFNSWMRTLFEREDKFNQDIDQLHQRVKALQLEILKYTEQVK